MYKYKRLSKNGKNKIVAQQNETIGVGIHQEFWDIVNVLKRKEKSGVIRNTLL